MAEFQACPTGLDAPCASRLLPTPGLTLSHAAYQCPSAPPHSLGKVANGEVDDKQGIYFSEIRSEGECPRLPSLKRLRQDEEESSNLPMSPPNEDGHPLLHHHQHHQHHHHHSAGETPTNNLFSVPHSQQPSIPESNGHAFEAQSFGSDPHLMPESVPQGGLLYPHISGPGSYQEVLAELERTKKKNIELQGRVTSLEAKLSKDEKHGFTLTNGSKKSKKARKPDKIQGEGDEEDERKAIRSSQSSLPPIKQEEGVFPQNTTLSEGMQPTDRQDIAVNWMSREEVTPADLEKLNNMVSEKDDSGDSDDDDDDDDEEDDDEDDEEREVKEGRDTKKSKGEGLQAWKGVCPGDDGKEGGGLDIKVEGGGEFPMVACSGKQQEEDESEDNLKKEGRGKKRRDGKKGRRVKKTYGGKRGFGLELPACRGPGIMSSYRKTPKTAFSPKEVERIMESGVLALKNAQSHTMRKIIVFASLGIRHGCEDLYELDFTNFSIEKRGEPFQSPKEPGEHVVYTYPGGKQQKMFYPNRRNPILCPVKILDEEKAMRPAGPSCPTCLFLCIKYGGRTRNLPQNEYVRQRMGRNKLKSFGPLMCQMALLVHIRTGSFFFKALGITLLFMAGFPDDLVRKETKYRNLDLLQKYYRSDEDAKQDILFHPYPTFVPQQNSIAGPSIPHKTSPLGPKTIGKKGPPLILSKPPNTTQTVPRYLQLMSTRTPLNLPFRGPPVAFPPALPPVPTVPPTSGTPGIPSSPGSLPPPFMYPGYAPVQRAPNGYPPLPVWPPVNNYPTLPGAYPPQHPYVYSPYAHSSQYGAQPFYGPPYGYPPFGGHPLNSKKEIKKEVEGSESDSDSDSNSSGAGQKSEEKGNSSDSKDAQ
ncbi:hypothetical protein Mapa_005208 [Marchantia paleacea]|nr:hypothetical protein Mapa_005208 [Marchantia paleacea]